MLKSICVYCGSSFGNDPLFEQGAKELGFLSFDLDDTLFHTGKVVRAANEVMLATLHDFGCTDVTLPEYLETTRAVRKKLDAPITYRGLRELAIRTTFETSKNFSVKSSNLDELVQTCYLAWETERQTKCWQSCEDLFADFRFRFFIISIPSVDIRWWGENNGHAAGTSLGVKSTHNSTAVAKNEGYHRSRNLIYSRFYS